MLNSRKCCVNLRESQETPCEARVSRPAGGGTGTPFRVFGLAFHGVSPTQEPMIPSKRPKRQKHGKPTEMAVSVNSSALGSGYLRECPRIVVIGDTALASRLAVNPRTPRDSRFPSVSGHLLPLPNTAPTHFSVSACSLTAVPVHSPRGRHFCVDRVSSWTGICIPGHRLDRVLYPSERRILIACQVGRVMGSVRDWTSCQDCTIGSRLHRG